MNEKKLLIVGIDPGITTAYAAFDIDGKFIHSNSSKQYDLGKIISEIIDFGKPVLVGTDKAKIPGMVESFAAKTGARIVSPSEDLKVDEKKKMIINLNFSDEHQADAAASALFAHREMRQLLDKIDFFAARNEKKNIRNLIKELVILRRISIKSAVSIIENRDEESKIIEKIITERIFSENDFLKLYGKLKKREEEIKLIKIHNNSLKNMISKLERSQSNSEKPRTEAKTQDDFREKRIKFLENMLNSKEKTAEGIRILLKKYNTILSNINNYHILKKLDTFGLNEFYFKNRTLNIQRNDILLVSNPNIASGKVIDFLKEKVFVVIYKNQITKKIENSMPFIFVSAKSLKIEEDKYFGFVEKKQLEMEKGKIDWVRKIIDDYKQEKEQLIR